MQQKGRSALSRRDALKVTTTAGLGLALAPRLWGATDNVLPRITRSIPSTGERLPVIGLGTNAFRESLRADLGAVLSRFNALGATMLDTAAMYGQSEQVIGELLRELKLRDKVFLATKFNVGGGGRASYERSLQRLGTDQLDLLYVHNLDGTDALIPQMVEWKQAKQIRYIGISTADDGQHALMVEQMKKHPLDFVQVNYGLGGRAAERTVLKTAAERRMAVVTNVPLGGLRSGNVQALLARPLPPWAAEIGCASWPQIMLKYVISHPAVTCVISGSTKAAHIDDNQQAGRGALPDAAMRRRIEQYWDALG